MLGSRLYGIDVEPGRTQAERGGRDSERSRSACVPDISNAHPLNELSEEDLMNHGVFTLLTRRASLLTLGAVGLASVALGGATDARKIRRN
jgi:hypothetical protein